MSRFEKYVNVTVRRELYEELKKLASEKNMSVPELLSYLLNLYRDFMSYWESLRTGKVPSNITGIYPSTYPSNIPSTSESQRAGQKRVAAVDILREQKVIFESDIAKRIRNRNSFFAKIEREGGVVIKTRLQRVAVDPEFWREFLRKLESIDTPDPSEASERLGSLESRLFNLLYSEGFATYVADSKKWVVKL